MFYVGDFIISQVLSKFIVYKDDFLFVWFDYLWKRFFDIEVQFKMFCFFIKNGNEICDIFKYFCLKMLNLVKIGVFYYIYEIQRFVIYMGYR